MPTLPAVGEADVRHVGVAADDRADGAGDVPEDLRPAGWARVDEHDLLVVAGSGVAEEDLAEAADGEGAGAGAGGGERGKELTFSSVSRAAA
jgi:hypothetical protein